MLGYCITPTCHFPPAVKMSMSQHHQRPVQMNHQYEVVRNTDERLYQNPKMAQMGYQELRKRSEAGKQVSIPEKRIQMNQDSKQREDAKRVKREAQFLSLVVPDVPKVDGCRETTVFTAGNCNQKLHATWNVIMGIKAGSPSQARTSGSQHCRTHKRKRDTCTL